MPVNSRNELKEYCLRKLGKPLVDINVDDTQIEDRIDDALKEFSGYHFSGSERLYYKHELTQLDIDNSFIKLPENIVSVIRVLPGSSSKFSDYQGMFNSEYQMMLGDFHNSSLPTVTDFVMKKTHFDFLSQVLGGTDSISFNRYKDKLVFNTMSERMTPGDFIIAECWSTIDPEEYTEIYNDTFVKKYTTSSIKQQWGMNLLKFEGANLPGGITLNGSRLYEDATEELEKLSEDLRDKYELPIDFMIG